MRSSKVFQPYINIPQPNYNDTEPDDVKITPSTLYGKQMNSYDLDGSKNKGH